MGVIVDDCKRAEVVALLVLVTGSVNSVIAYISPLSYKLPAGWEHRVRLSMLGAVLLVAGLAKEVNRMRHASSAAEYAFGVQDCPPSRVDRIHWMTAAILSVGILPFTNWLCHAVSWKLLVLRLPAEVVRLAFRIFVVFLGALFWAVTSVAAPLFNLMFPPLAILFPIAVLAVSLLWHRGKMNKVWSELYQILSAMWTLEHFLDFWGVFLRGNLAYRERWYRYYGLQSHLRPAMLATLPGLIGPLSVQGEDPQTLKDAVAALRGLDNKWSDLEEKMKYLADKKTMMYALSYRHVPVWQEGRKIRMRENRACCILEQIAAKARADGFHQFMLWCDGASAAGSHTDAAWWDIGLLPYALFRTFRVETHVNDDNVTFNRLWLELEKQLASLTAGSECTRETILEAHPDECPTYSHQEQLVGLGYKPMAAVLKMTSRIAQGDYAACEASQVSDIVDMATWARRFLVRSGEQEMNEPLGWQQEPRTDVTERNVLIRVSTTNRRFLHPDEAEVAFVEYGRIRDEPTLYSFWLRLLGFTDAELERLTLGTSKQEDLLTVQFQEKNSGNWKCLVLNLQGAFDVCIALFCPQSETASPSDTVAWETSGWLLTNSQQSIDLSTNGRQDFLEGLIGEMFRARKMKFEVTNIKVDGVEDIQEQPLVCYEWSSGSTKDESKGTAKDEYEPLFVGGGVPSQS